MPQLNQPIRHLFSVTSIVGAPVTGLTTVSFTIVLRRDSAGALVSASEVVTIVEEGAGLYWADYAAASTSPLYFGEISHATHIVSPGTFQDAILGPGAVSGPYLTTLARVKEQLFAGDATPPSTHDTLINTIIAEVTHRIRSKVDNRRFIEQAHVEYVDGRAVRTLRLAQGPLVSVSRIDLVTYSDGGGGARTETPVEVEAYRWLPRGLRVDGHLGKGWIDRLDSFWIAGQRNYKVTYTAGFDPLPAFLVESATKETLNEVRHDPAVQMLKIGDYEIRTPLPKDRELALSRALSPLMDVSVG